ncbi:MAG: hypothetical protein CMM80_01640 [Rhodospirillaceae bacterium]|nr:hypothetical protein [Rhodospirillaceae bacterium]
MIHPQQFDFQDEVVNAVCSFSIIILIIAPIKEEEQTLPAAHYYHDNIYRTYLLVGMAKQVASAQLLTIAINKGLLKVEINENTPRESICKLET